MYSLTSFLSNAPATTEIYTLSLHDALPISGADTMGVADLLFERRIPQRPQRIASPDAIERQPDVLIFRDRKSTRLNSSHVEISYAVFCLKKKKKNKTLREIQTSITRRCLTL